MGIESKLNVLLLAGSETKVDNVIKKRNTSKKNYDVDYLEGLKKAYEVVYDGVPQIEHVAEIINGAKSVDEVFVSGPKKDLTKNANLNCDIIDTNASLMENVAAGIEGIVSKRGHSLIGILTVDLPGLTTKMIDDYVSLIENDLKGKDFVIQFLNKESLNIGEDSYDKPAYNFKKDGKNYELIIGHFHFGKSENLNMDLFKGINQMLYDIRCESDEKKSKLVKKGIYKLFKDGHLKLRHIPSLLRVGIAYKRKKLTEENFVYGIEKVFIKSDSYKGKGMHGAIGISYEGDWGLDLDTLQELEDFRDNKGVNIDLSESAKNKFDRINKMRSFYNSCNSIGCDSYFLKFDDTLYVFSGQKMNELVDRIEAKIILDKPFVGVSVDEVIDDKILNTALNYNFNLKIQDYQKSNKK